MEKDKLNSRGSHPLTTCVLPVVFEDFLVGFPKTVSRSLKQLTTAPARLDVLSTHNKRRLRARKDWQRRFVWVRF